MIKTTEELENLDLIACYFDISYNNLETWEEADELIAHHFDQYAVGKEVSKEQKIEHIHICGTEKKPGKSYIAFITAIKRKWHLTGKALEGKRKQYGRVRKIKSKLNMLAYTIKDGNYKYNGFQEEYIKWVEDEVSYEKPENRKDKYNNLKKVLKNKMEEYSVEQDIFPPLEKEEYVGIFLVEEYFKIFNSLPTKPMITKLYYEIGLMSATTYYHYTMGGYSTYKINENNAY